MEQDLPPRALAVYLHIPFCLSRCGYCSFFSQPYSKSALDAYLRFLHREIDLFAVQDPDLLNARTIYFGGGTPSLLEAEDIIALCRRFRITSGAEITLEINPLQITEPHLEKLRQTPVNRLSIGLQSMDDSELALLDRRHRSGQIPPRIALCRSFGYNNISLDLIYGLPGSDVSGLKENLRRFVTLEPEHISAYLLTLEADSELARKIGSGLVPPLPDEDEQAAQYDALCAGLQAAGYGHYEISNFCRPGKASRHNLSYWKSEPYLGLGASASGWLPPFRYTDQADLDAYYKQLDAGKILPGAEKCSTEQQKADFLMMGLRLAEGVDRSEYQKRFGTDLYAEKQSRIDKLVSLGLLESNQNSLKLSPAAFFVSNSVIGELL